MRLLKMFLGGALACSVAGVSFAAPVIGQKAPDFSVKDSQGRTQHLSDYKGRYVVLEWFNDQCPFVHKHYDSGNMQKLQETWRKKGVVWLTINSSAPGKAGQVSAEQANEDMRKFKAAPTAFLLDSAGLVGRLYGAKTTPDMFVIDPAGTLLYKGAIDDKPSADPADIAGAKNYVSAALEEAMAGKPIRVSATSSYGCSIKYE